MPRLPKRADGPLVPLSFLAQLGLLHQLGHPRPVPAVMPRRVPIAAITQRGSDPKGPIGGQHGRCNRDGQAVTLGQLQL